MHHPSLGRIPPSFTVSTGSPDHLGQDYNETDHNADMFPPATEYDIPTPGHQELGNVNGDGDDSDSLGWERESLGPEFVGPVGRTYRNFHPGLNAQRCDASGQYLSDDAPPPLSVERSSDDWSPFRNRLEFELADFLFRQAEMPAKKIDTLLEIWATSLLALCGEPLFANQKDLYRVIDSTSVGEMDKAAIWLLGCSTVTMYGIKIHVKSSTMSLLAIGRIDYVPYWEYDSTNNQRRWEDFMSGAWAWNEADRIISEDPTTAGATLIPIILSSDKTTVSVATGQTDYYPLYLSIGNVRNTVRHAHCSAVVLIRFLAMPKTTREHAGSSAFQNFKRQLFHSSLTRILCSLRPAMSVPEIILCGDKYYRRIIYSLVAYIADYEEQVLLSCIVWNWCPKCLAHWESLDDDALHRRREHADAMIEEFDFRKLWDTYGIVGDIVPFTNDFPRADIYGMLSPDILHQLIKGGFKDHLVDWVEHYLIHVHGKTQAEKVLDEIDRQIAAVAPYTGLRRFPQGRHFKQWTGNDSKGLMKVYIAAIEGYVPQYVVFTFQAFLEFCYLIHRNVITQQTLVEIDDALRHFHLYHKVFRNAGVVDTFSLPRQHAMKHYSHLICQFGAPNGLCSSITESKHIKAVKQPYQRTNHFQALRQMLLINQRLNKLITAHADFKECGMLNEPLLSHALRALGQHSSDADDLCDQVGESHDMADEIEEQAGSYEEELGNAIDAPRSVKAHVSLARTHQRKRARTIGALAAELCLPQLPNILRHFLYSQLFPTDDLDDIALDECPPYDGSVHVYNSACSTFFAPSDLCGRYGMRCEHIRSCPMWRNEGPRFDCVFVVTDPEAEGMRGLDIAHVLCFFSFKYQGTLYPCAVVHWFDRMGDGPDIATGMWIVCPSYNARNVPHIAIIHIDAIYRAAHLIPVYAAHNINTRDIKPHDSYDTFNSFYVNKFADHHAFEIAF
ncbi:hypothetical protein BKA82DRAFT_28768 [Pisolithus tinctorius]|uniref:C2H2-type domain-containing protein n=1 Tax=Pisolithus tinctorius Marx 270 TaxID=870435 RepID=A0A0C3P1T6_PISTI|nr:hypothetical protein BKA82DRAFT_28768 [Pisolithus tinctorius]KIO01466.1 hypothetical protein M404DRAFT_28768 [Pisolithus tinctorius Marx 270]